MSPFAVIAVWAGGGIAGHLVIRTRRLRPLGVLLPAGALAALLLAQVASAPALPGTGSAAAPTLDRTAQGLLAAAAGATVVTVLLAGPVRRGTLLTMGVAGAAAVAAVTSVSSLSWALALLAAAVVISLRWVGASPGRLTLAAGRLAVGGALLLVITAALLPVTPTTGPKPLVVGALLACGLGSLLGLLPIGGWTRAGGAAVDVADTAAWMLLVAPAVVLLMLRDSAGLPAGAVVAFQTVLLTLGLCTAGWSGAMAAWGTPQRRYRLVFAADMGLVAAAIGAGHLGFAQLGALFLVLTHLVAGPLLLQPSTPAMRRQRRLAWLLLTGVPPSPSFWGRVLLTEALAALTRTALIPAVVILALLFLAAMLGMRERLGRPAAQRDAVVPRVAPWQLALQQGAAWLVVLGGVGLGLFSRAAATFVFGSG